MALETQTVGGANPFTGLANAGLVQFDLPSADGNYRALLHSVALSSVIGAGCQATDIRLQLTPFGNPAGSERIILFENAGPLDSFVTVCKQIVPRAAWTELAQARVSWQLVFTCTKVAQASLVVDWDVTRLPISR